MINNKSIFLLHGIEKRFYKFYLVCKKKRREAFHWYIWFCLVFINILVVAVLSDLLLYYLP